MNFSLLKNNCSNFYRKFAAFLFLAAGAGLSVVATPFLIGRIVDILSKTQINYKSFYLILFAFAGFAVISFFFSKTLQKRSSLLALEICQNLRKKMFDRLNNVKLGQMSQNSIGEYQSRLTSDIEKVYAGLSVFFNLAFLSALTIISMLIMMIFINVFALILVFTMLPLAFIISRFISKNSAKYFAKEACDLGEIYGLCEEFLSNQKSAKLLGINSCLQQKMESANESYRKSSQNAQFFSALTMPSTRFVNNGVYVLLGLLGGLLCLYQGLSVGSVVAFLGYATGFAAPINNFTSVTAEFLTVSASLKRIENTLALEIEEDFGTRELVQIDDISFNEISFKYPAGKQVFSGFSLHVKKGTKVAITGKTGSGKTTLVNLLLRFFELDGGEILINGIDAREYTLESLRSAFSMVLQETWLFSGTILENLKFAKEDAIIEEVDEILQKTMLAKHSKKFENGIETEISEGDSLSAGQRQLIAVARAMLSPAQNLILDEATSNLDIVTEKQISHNFMQMMQGKTTFIIAHRLSTIESCDVKVTL